MNMFKILIALLSASISFPSFAASKACLEKIVNSENFPRGMTGQEIECLADTDAGKIGLAKLCSSDQVNLSSMYSAYYLHRGAFHGALWRLTSATETATEEVWLAEIRKQEKDWKRFGFYHEVNDLLGPKLHQAQSTCRFRRF